MADAESPGAAQSINPPLPLPPARRAIILNQQRQQEKQEQDVNNKPPTRHVVFSDSPPKEYVLERVPEEGDESHKSSKEEYSDGETNTVYLLHHDDKDRKRRCPGCCICCSWICLVVCIIFLLVFVCGLFLVMHIKSSLPQAYLTRVEFPKMEAATSSKKLVLNTELKAVIQVFNRNDHTVIHYSPMKVDVTSDKVELGRAKLSGFKQKPNTKTTLEVHTRVKRSRVYDLDATVLKSNFKLSLIVIDVILTGKIGVEMVGIKIQFPVVISCKGVKIQNDVKRKLKRICKVETIFYH